MNFSITGMCIITFKLVFLPRHKEGLKKTNGILEPSFEIPSWWPSSIQVSHSELSAICIQPALTIFFFVIWYGFLVIPSVTASFRILKKASCKHSQGVAQTILLRCVMIKTNLIDEWCTPQLCARSKMATFLSPTTTKSSSLRTILSFVFVVCTLVRLLFWKSFLS